MEGHQPILWCDSSRFSIKATVVIMAIIMLPCLLCQEFPENRRYKERDPNIESFILNEEVQVARPTETVLHERVGTLFPTINFAHIRIQIRISNLTEIKDAICNQTIAFSPLVNWTANSANHTNVPGPIRDVYMALAPRNKVDLPSPAYSMMMRANLKQLTRNFAIVANHL